MFIETKMLQLKQNFKENFTQQVGGGGKFILTIRVVPIHRNSICRKRLFYIKKKVLHYMFKI